MLLLALLAAGPPCVARAAGLEDDPPDGSDPGEKDEDEPEDEGGGDEPREQDTPDLDLPPREAEEQDEASASTTEHELGETLVTGSRRPEATAASHYAIELGELSIIPRRNASEHLMLAPGVLTTNHGGEGHAQEVFMRGFAAGEGQDIEFLVDGVPLNEVSNAHGHGYADLHLIPPEFVRRVHVTEGAFDPEQGDFAFAGTADYELGLAEAGAQVKYGAGLWNTHRVLTTWAPPGRQEDTFAGFEFFRTSGYGTNRAAQRATAIGRYTDRRQRERHWAIGVYGYASRFDQAGVIREDDYDAGEVGFYDTYDPNQGGESNRILLTFDVGAGPREARFEQVAFAGYRTMRLRANFTGWMTDTLVDDDGTVIEAQRGDGVEMRYRVFTGGARGAYRLARDLAGRTQELDLGYTLRADAGRSEQMRLRSVTAIPYETLFDTDFCVLNLAAFLRTQLRPLPWLAIRGGVRLDTFAFGVTDYDQPDADRDGTRLPHQTAQAFGLAVNPRVSLDLRIVGGLHAVASYGHGTRSSEAMALSDNETAPFARAQEVDGGLTYTLGTPGAPVHLHTQASYSLTRVDKDLLFSATEGRNVLVGSSTRHVALLSTRVQLKRWFDAALNLGFTHATLDETGELLPYIPRLVLRLDAAVAGQPFGWHIGPVPLTGRIGAGFTYVPGRPLPMEQTGDPFFLINVGGELRLWHFGLGLEIRNLLNRQYRQSEFYYASNFDGPDAVPSKASERHFAAGEPFFVMGTLTLHIEDLVRTLDRASGTGDRADQPRRETRSRNKKRPHEEKKP